MRALRARVRSLLAGGDDAALRALLATLLERWRPPWSALPDGWRVEEDASGSPVWHADAVHGLEARRTRPTATAADAAEAKRAGRRAVAAFEADLAARRPPPAAAAAATTSTTVDAAALARKKDRDDSAATTAARADALARAEAMERKERKAAASGGAAGRCRGGVAALLKRLELEQYVEPFAKAGVDDAALAELAATIDADKKEGADAVDALIARVPVRGGSGVRLRKALLEKDGGRGRGGGAAGRGGRAVVVAARARRRLLLPRRKPRNRRNRRRRRMMARCSRDAAAAAPSSGRKLCASTVMSSLPFL